MSSLRLVSFHMMLLGLGVSFSSIAFGQDTDPEPGPADATDSTDETDEEEPEVEAAPEPEAKAATERPGDVVDVGELHTALTSLADLATQEDPPDRHDLVTDTAKVISDTMVGTLEEIAQDNKYPETLGYDLSGFVALQRRWSRHLAEEFVDRAESHDDDVVLDVVIRLTTGRFTHDLVAEWLGFTAPGILLERGLARPSNEEMQTYVRSHLEESSEPETDPDAPESSEPDPEPNGGVGEAETVEGGQEDNSRISVVAAGLSVAVSEAVFSFKSVLAALMKSE